MTFVTGNPEKFEIAQATFQKHGLHLVQEDLDTDEIQSEDGDKIVRDKVSKAYEALKRPVVVNDDSWAIPGLNGFPGPYMKSILHWLTVEDLLRLTAPLEDRRIILSQRIAYQHDQTQKVFLKEYTGTILKESAGVRGNTLWKIISMPGDEGLSVSQAFEQGRDPAKREVAEGWEAFIDWYKETNT